MTLQRKMTIGQPHLGKRSSRESKQDVSVHSRGSTDSSNSPILRLPVEIVLLVGENSSPASILALRQTCRQFYNALEAPDLRRSSAAADRTEFRALMKRQQFFESCELEDRKGLHQLQTKPLCSACLTRHWKTAFTNNELDRSPSERMCKGSQRSLRVCSHIAFKFNELQESRGQVHHSAMHYTNKNDLHNASCTVSDPDASCCPDALYFYHGKPLFKEEARYPHEEWAPSIWLHCTFPILQGIAGRHSTTVAMVAEALKDIDTPICPHMTVNDPQILRTAYKSGRRLWNTKKAFRDQKPITWLHTWTPLWHESTMSSCVASNCLTVFNLRLELASPEADLYNVKLCVQRDVGLLLDASDHKWLAQIQAEEVKA